MTKDDDTGSGTSAVPGSEPAGGEPKGDEGAWREQNTRLRQELAEQKELNRKAVPLVQVALALGKADPTTYEKLVKGEPLTAKQAATVDAAASAAGMTAEDFDKRLDEKLGLLLQRMQADRQAETGMRELDAKAAKELEGYDKLKGTATWNGVLSSVMGAIENGTYPVPEGVEDPYYWAIEQTYAIVKSQNPELAKGKKPVAKAEAERAAEILAGGRKPSASSGADELSGLPDDERREIEFIRSIGETQGEKFSK